MKVSNSTGNEGVDTLLLFDDERILEAIFSISDDLKEFRSKDDIVKMLEKKGFHPASIDILMDIGKTRKRSIEKFPNKKDILFTTEGLRWATPESAAEMCAARMERDHVMDITCGQGGQTLALSERCSRVTAVDLDPLNCLITRLNCSLNGYDNVEVVNDDCLSNNVIEKAGKGTAIFSDPARPPGSKERTFDEILPDPRIVFEKYEKTVSSFCFEIPPYLSLDKLPFDCEAEFVSIDGRLNRLNLYLGDLKEQERSAIILPGEERISGPPSEIDVVKAPPGKKYSIMNELDPSLKRAGLISILIENRNWDCICEHLDERRTVLWSAEPLHSSFIKDSYHSIMVSDDLDKIHSTLLTKDASKVTLRFKIDPSDYWTVRNRMEKGLKGSRQFQLFKHGSYYLVERIERSR